MAILPTIQARIQLTDTGAILFDTSAAKHAGCDSFREEWFEPSFWREAGAASAQTGGRGGVVRARVPGGDWILRHYRRGGLAARLMGDRYLWSGAERSRGFAEFRLLANLRHLGLNVPAPIAARFRRTAMHYTADLITGFIANARTFAEVLRAEPIDAALVARVGEAIGEFHAAGVYHADLNAHNIMCASRSVWLIDFDRGEMRIPEQSWQARNLARLRRSLIKLGVARSRPSEFEVDLWQPLLIGYATGLHKLSTPIGRDARS